MNLGAFMMPNHPPHRSPVDGHEHDVEYLEFLDRLGYHEAWIGEHYTVTREPCPSPDLLVAQALMRTENIRVSPGGFMLPYHHPAELAHRIAWLDHIARGRCYIGVGSSAITTDWAMFNVDGGSGENRRMTEESLEIMIRFWESEEPFEYVGEFWTVRRPPSVDENYSYHIKPYTKPYPEIAIAGFSPRSPTLAYAGQKGFIPLSFGFTTGFVADHWEAHAEGAEEVGRTADRSRWRISRDIFIADTDEEAWDRAVNGAIGEHYRKFWLPMLNHVGLIGAAKHDPDVADSDVTVEYVAEHGFFVGSPETVQRKIEDMIELSGGFGCLLLNSYDHLDHDNEAWRESVERLATEVMPKFADVDAAAG